MTEISRRKLPTLPYELSAVCFGTAQFGVSIPEERAFELLDTYYRMAGNFLDTANLYGRQSPLGENLGEQIIGRWMKMRGVRDVTVATKACHFSLRARDISRVNAECARADAEDSLRTLGLEVLPLYWLHRDDERRPIEEIVEFCEALKREGKVLRYGFSNYSTERIRGALAYADRMGYERIFAVSNEWNLAGERAAPYTDPSGMKLMNSEEYALHRRENLPIIPFTAAAHGYFSSLDTGELPSNKAARFDSAENRALLSILRKIAQENSASVAEVAVAYLLCRDIPVIPVVSTSRPEHLLSFAKISSLQIDVSALSIFTE